MSTHQGWALALALGASACGGPVIEPREADAELIVFGGGPGGVREACFTCHGLAGEGIEEAPRLAGLDAGYLAKQMADYANGRRADAVMAPIARRLSAEAQRQVSHYYAALPATAPPLAIAPRLYAHGDAARGLRACAECHGASGQGAGPANPALAGQPQVYTVEQMRRWKRGLRRNDAGDVMGTAARGLSETEIEALAAYLAGAS